MQGRILRKSKPLERYTVTVYRSSGFQYLYLSVSAVRIVFFFSVHV